MKITVIQGFIEGFYEEGMTYIYEGHLTTEQVEVIGRKYGNIGNGGYARMKVIPYRVRGHDAWNIDYFNTPERDDEPEVQPGDGISTAGDQWESDYDEDDEGKGDLSYSVQHDETEHAPSSSPADVGRHM